MHQISRREFLKLGLSGIGSLAASPFLPGSDIFDDATQVRVATKAVSVYRSPTDQSQIVSQWFRDDLLNIYEELETSAPLYNPIWYRVWGGYVHRGRLQKVKVIFNKPLDSL